MMHKIHYNFLLNIDMGNLNSSKPNSFSMKKVNWVNKLNVCDCSDECIYQILQKEESDRINDINHQKIVGPSDLHYMVKNGLAEIVKNDCLDYEDLNSDGRELINWCVDYLKYRNENPCNMQYNIIDYIHNFLKIKKQSGYDYWPVNYLENKGFITRASNIMHSWYEEDNITCTSYKTFIF